MKLGIMQPYFFPYIGYFQLMKAVDEWVFFDDIQFIDKGWINRNRILHPEVEKEWQFITIPLAKRGQFDQIVDITIKQDGKWKQQILGKLGAFKKKAPFYKRAYHLVSKCLEQDEDNLSRFLISTLKETAELLDISVKYHVQSEMNLALGDIEHPGQWALRISEKMQANEYVNPVGGKHIFNNKEFVQADIKLSFLQPVIEQYPQRRPEFVSGLSIIDVLLWNDLEQVRDMTRKYSILQESQ